MTRDEAIVIVNVPRTPTGNASYEQGYADALRLAMLRLAAAGVFAPDDVTGCDDSCASGKPCPKSQTMADKLDAAGIR